jgi:hypothetical protein
MSWDAFMFVPPLPLLNNTIDGHYMNELEAECSPNSLGSAGIGFDRAQRMHAYKGATLSPDSQDAPRARTSAKRASASQGRLLIMTFAPGRGFPVHMRMFPCTFYRPDWNEQGQYVVDTGACKICPEESKCYP